MLLQCPGCAECLSRKVVVFHRLVVDCCHLLVVGLDGGGPSGRSALASAQTLRFCNYSVCHIRRQAMRCLCHMWCTSGREE